jgi:fatty-acyl-CoA synthase
MTRKIETSHTNGPDLPPVVELSVGAALRQVAAEVPHRLALIEGIVKDRRRWTYAELLRDAEASARTLRARYEPGTRIGVWVPNTPEFVVFQFGVALAGMVLVTVNPTFREAEFRFSIQQSGARACLVYPEFRGSPMALIAKRVQDQLDNFDEIIDVTEFPAFLEMGDQSVELPWVDPLSPAQIQYTSGTTGTPKGALIPHRAMVNDPRQAAILAGGQDGDVWMGILPLFHVGGCVLAAMGTLSLRGTLLPLLNFDAGVALRLVEEEHVTIMNPVPTMLTAITQHPDFALRDLSSLRSIISGGATVPPEMVRSIEESLGINFVVVFGQTETTGVITMTTITDTVEDKAFTAGRPLPGVEVKIVSAETGDTVPLGEVGEVMTRGYHTMVGYHGNPEGTAAALEPDGWLHTGDLAVMDERGYIQISGRIKDMIIRGGENLFPREIEDELFRHPALASTVIVGVPDDYYGEVPVAFVQLADGHAVTGDDLAEYLRPWLSGYKIPAKWYRVTEYPATLSGKVQKFVLRNGWINGEYHGHEL